MHSIRFLPKPEDRDALIVDLWENGTTGIVEDDSGLRAFFADEIEITGLLNRWRRAVAQVSDASFDQAETTMNADNWEPVLIGERFLVAPSWVPARIPPGRRRLTLDSNAAFGTGRHESTQLMIEALEKYVRGGETVCDIGCGSGILGMAARELGVGQVFSCDIEFDIAAVPRLRAIGPIFLGSADALTDAVADVLLANISARVIDTLAHDLNRIAKPGALLLLSGFVRENPPEAFQPVSVTEKGDWLCWTCRPQISEEYRIQTRRVLTHSHNWW